MTWTKAARKTANGTIRRLTALMLALAMLAAVWTAAFAEGARQVDMSNYAYVRGDYRAVDLAAKSVFYVEMYKSDMTCIGSGSGFVMFDEGLFITNQHVIEGTSFLLIMDDDGRQYLLDKVLVSDKEHDIAILYFLEGKNYRSLPYDTAFDRLVRAQPVLTIGSPQGLSGTVSDGIISAFPKFKGEDTRYIQITAPISHGSSGGCLLNEDLKVIGVTSSGVEAGENLGFAIPVFIVEQLYLQWNKRDFVSLGTERAWDTVGAGLHSRISGAADKPQAPVSAAMTESPATAAPIQIPAPTPSGMPLPSTSGTGEKTIKPGDYVTFGHYSQTAEGNDRTPIEWLVLEVQGNKALLLSRYGLDVQRYNTKNAIISWENSTLRAWLNKDFYNKAFIAKEKKAILTTAVVNSKAQGYWNTNGGKNTEDRIFLLSYAEANKYLGLTEGGKNTTKSRVAPTAYAVTQGASTISNCYTADGEAAWWWWLRSPGPSQITASRVHYFGTLDSTYVDNASCCVRPALWVNLESALAPTDKPLQLPSTDGTAEKKIKAGDYVTFGHYPQTAAGNDQTPIEWLVLEVQGNKALLLSRYGLESKPFNEKFVDITWEKCTLRSWLNQEFMNEAFSSTEQKAILTTAVDNGSSQGYSKWNTRGGNNTQDKIFLLSCGEAYKYLGVTWEDSNNIKSRTSPTAYAVQAGAQTSDSNKTADGKAAGWWWLRSPGYYQSGAASVLDSGSLLGGYVINDGGCVRPALWVNLDSGIF